MHLPWTLSFVQAGAKDWKMPSTACPKTLPAPRTLILNLIREAENIIAHSSTPNSLIHVYFIAGLIAITEKIKDHIYEEVFSTNHSNQPHLVSCHVPHLPIIEIHFKDWRHPMLCNYHPHAHEHLEWTSTNIHRTSYLLHHNHYDSMQTNLIKTVTEINSLITELNISNYIQTPWLAQHTLYKPGQRQQTYKFRHHLLADGIHASDTLKIIWAKTLTDTMSLNRFLAELQNHTHPS